MFMAVVAGIFFIITGLSMAGNAAGSVIAVKPEIPVMIKGCRFPCSIFMANCAVCLRKKVQSILWLVSFVARNTFLPYCRGQLAVIEGRRFPVFGAMAFGAIAFCKTMHRVLRLLIRMAGDALFLL